MDRQACILQEFGHRFRQYKNKNMVIYLREFDPTPIFQNYSDYNFVGVMDKYMDSGTAYGKEILSFERVLELQTDLMIIASDPMFYELIRSRIAGFCRNHGIGLFTVDGTKLSLESDAVYADGACHQLHAGQVKRQVDASGKVIFQVYDTLFMKKAPEETVLYELMGERVKRRRNIQDAFGQAGFSGSDFSSIRQQCQQELEEEQEMSPAGAGSALEQIYQRFCQKTGVLSDCAAQLLEMEKSLRRKLTVPRKDMLDLFRDAVQKGKQIVLLEDTCLSRRDTEELLDRYGISGYRAVRLCSEEGKRRLYRRLAKEGQGDTVLYIGTIDEAKRQIFQNAGIEVCGIPSAKEMLESSVYYRMVTQENGWYDGLKAGFFAAGMFHSPFALYQMKGKGAAATAEEIGFLFLGPLVMDFMVWFINRIKQDRIQLVLFGARDGYLVEKLYRMILERTGMEGYPQGVYVPASRLLCSMAGLFTEEDLKEALKKPYGGSVQSLLTERFLLREEELLPYPGENAQNRDTYVLRHTDIILARAAQIREQYQSYGRACGIGRYEKTAFFDFFASGTSQYCLERIFQTQLAGYYFYRFFSGDSKKDAMQVCSYISQNAKIMENSLFMECIFTSADPPAAAFDLEGNLVFAKENRSKEEIAYCGKLQEGVLTYISQFVDVLGSPQGLAMAEADDSFLDYLYPDFTEIRNEIFHNYMVKDEFLGYESHVGRLYRY